MMPIYCRGQAGTTSYAVAVASGWGQEAMEDEGEESEVNNVQVLLLPPKLGLSHWKTASRELFVCQDAKQAHNKLVFLQHSARAASSAQGGSSELGSGSR